MIFKIFWILRGLIYKPFFGKFGFPSYIGKPIFIGNFKRIFIGKKVRIMPNARIEVVDKNSSIVFENNISIAQNLHIISGGNQELRIGKNTTFSANIFITNVDHEYQDIDTHIMEQKLIFNKTQIGENCFIGYSIRNNFRKTMYSWFKCSCKRNFSRLLCDCWHTCKNSKKI